MQKPTFILSCFLLLGSFCSAQEALHPTIKSIVLRPSESESYAPIVPLGETLILSFDDLDGDQKEYQYKITRMTFDWKPSTLLANEYINGFSSNSIQDYENSFNTLQNYTHYALKIPNKTLQIKKSGNYMVTVLDPYNQAVFSRRFTLYEKKVAVGVRVLRSRNIATRDQQQTVNFTINYSNFKIQNPSQEIQVALIQNNNWQTAITNLKPQFYKQNQLIYNSVDQSNFWGGNEFLNFDNKRISLSNLTVAKAVRGTVYQSYLHPQEIRKNKLYTYNPDINGQFIIRTLNGANNDTEADYAQVHFSLLSEKISNKKLYVYGAFNNYKLSAENQLNYHKDQGMYTTTILLKQGFYNYCFVSLGAENKLDLYSISGSFYQTENDYTVLVYYRAFGENYQRVIGLGIASSTKKE